MSEEKTIRINKVLRELNISLDRAVEHLKEKGHEIEARPTTKISTVEYQVLLDEFQTDMSKKVASIEVGEEKRKEKEALLQQIEKEQEEKKAIKEKEPTVIRGKATLSGPKKVGKIDLNPKTEVVAEPEKVEEKEKAPVVEEVKEPAKEEQLLEVKNVAAAEAPKEAEAPKKEEVKEEKPAAEAESDQIKTQYQTLSGPKIVGAKIDLSQFEKKKKPAESNADNDRKRKRKRIVSDKNTPKGGNKKSRKKSTSSSTCRTN